MERWGGLGLKLVCVRVCQSGEVRGGGFKWVRGEWVRGGTPLALATLIRHSESSIGAGVDPPHSQPKSSTNTPNTLTSTSPPSPTQTPQGLFVSQLGNGGEVG
eukprot:scaffold50113_cov191-Isochrysis_galbana.AAC.1